MGKTFWQVFITRFLVTLTIILSIFALFLYQRINTSKEMARMAAQEALTHVDIVLNTMIDKTNMIEGFLHSFGEERMREMATRLDGKIYLDEFNLFTSMLYDSPSIRALQLLPAGITLYSYPLKGNEAAIGDNVLEREEPRASAIFAMRSGLTVVDGPHDLLQGGMSLIARNPIYYQDGTFWGFAVIILALPEVIEPLGLNDLLRQGYEFEFDFIQNGNPTTISSNLSAQNAKNVIEETKLLAGRRVCIKVVPQEGWIKFEDAVLEFTFFFIVALLIAYLGTRYRLSSLQLVKSLEKEKFLRLVTAQAYKEAEQANNAKSDFLSAMSHDLRTPMNAIVGLCVLLKRDMDKPQKVADYSRKINASCQHLLGLINDILDMNKIESGKSTFNMREFSLATLIDNLNTIVRPQARAKKQAFEIKLQHIKHEFLIADNLRLNQILLNLLSNAVKYTQVGGHISLIVTEEEERSNNIARYTFEVVDNGMGMSKEFLGHIYEPFVRADNVIGSAIQGTGLGMTITHNLVNLLGGSIAIDSKENEGTSVRVHLSLKIKTEEVKDSEFLKIYGISRILLVDDEGSVSESVSHTMSEAGVETFHAYNGKQAFSALEKLDQEGKQINLILLDLVLQDESGLDVAKALQESKFKDIPIFILTSYDYSDIELEGMNIGIKGFLMKPLFISNLKQALINAANNESHQEPEDNHSVLEGMHILAAEDNELNSEILVELLSMRGANCTVCSDGVEIVEKFKQSYPGQYDFILMDVQMPRLNGLDATRQIRALDLPHAKDITIIAMTANAFTEDIKASLDAGMNYHISKPIDLDLLEDYVRKVRAGHAPNLSASYAPTAKRTSKEDAAREEEEAEARENQQDLASLEATDSISYAATLAGSVNLDAQAAPRSAASPAAPRPATPPATPSSKSQQGQMTQQEPVAPTPAASESKALSGSAASGSAASAADSPDLLRAAQSSQGPSAIFGASLSASLSAEQFNTKLEHDDVCRFNVQAVQDIAAADAQAAQQLAEAKAHLAQLQAKQAQQHGEQPASGAEFQSSANIETASSIVYRNEPNHDGLFNAEAITAEHMPEPKVDPNLTLGQRLGAKVSALLNHSKQTPEEAVTSPLAGMSKLSPTMRAVMSLVHKQKGQPLCHESLRRAKLIAQASMQGTLPSYGMGANHDVIMPTPNISEERFKDGTETQGYLKLAEVAAVNDVFINAMEGKGRGSEPYNPDFKSQEIAALERTAAADQAGIDHAHEGFVPPDDLGPKGFDGEHLTTHAPDVLEMPYYQKFLDQEDKKSIAEEERHELLKQGVTIFNQQAGAEGQIKVTPELIAEATRELDELHLKVKADPTLLAEATRDLEKLRSSFDNSKPDKNRGVIDAIISGTGFAKAFGLDDAVSSSSAAHSEAHPESKDSKPNAPAEERTAQDTASKHHDGAQ